jgi:hypothetical protein
VARAKRTDRAEARRRYRAYLQDQAEAEGAEGEEDGTPEPRASAKASRTPEAGVVRPGQRVGFVAAMKMATHPIHYGDDLRYAPTLIFRTNAIWPTVLLSLGALAYGLMQNDFQGGGFQFVLSFLIAMPPLVQPIVAGFMAPRATWLAGVVSGLFSGACYEVLILWAANSNMANMPAGLKLASNQYLPATVQLMAIAITFGALLGAGSGWYKRFLGLTSGSSTRPPQRSSAKKPASRRSTARR